MSSPGQMITRNMELCADCSVPLIVFADDSEDTLLLFSIEAQRRGWCYLLARTAREMIDVVNRECATGRCPDLLVMDINFRDKTPDPGPRLTGISAAQSIRDAYGNMPVIFYTGWDNSLVEEQAQPLANPKDHTGEIIVKQKTVLDDKGRVVHEGDIVALMNRAAYWIDYWRSARYSGPERRRASIMPTDRNLGRRISDRPRRAEIAEPLKTILAQVRKASL